MIVAQIRATVTIWKYQDGGGSCRKSSIETIPRLQCMGPKSYNMHLCLSDESMCDITLPYCVIYGENQCKRPSKYDDCSYHDSTSYDNFIFHARTAIEGHGLNLDYSFYECQGKMSLVFDRSIEITISQICLQVIKTTMYLLHHLTLCSCL